MDRYTFRGKHIGSGEWLVGDLCQRGDIYIFPPDGLDSYDNYEVDAATVGQRTGLKDNEGAMLYEGDVVEVNCKEYPMIEDGILGTVAFGEYQHIGAQMDYPNGDLGFFVEWLGEEKEMLRNDILYWTENGYVKKIGNVHDNPELIKEDA